MGIDLRPVGAATKRVLGAVVLVLALSPGAPAQLELQTAEKKELKRTFERFAKADPGEREALRPHIYQYGRPGLQYLDAQARRPEHVRAMEDLRREEKEALGLDLIEQQRYPAQRPRYSPGYFRMGEIVLVKSGELCAGFAVTEGSHPENGSIRVEWWSQKSAAKRLGGPGGQSGSLDVEGEPAAGPMRPNTGYQEYHFPFEIQGIPVEIRYVGPAYFRYRFGAAEVAFAMTGWSEARKIAAADKRLRFEEHYPEKLALAAELLQQYLFRSVPGCEPLPLAESDRREFAQYEMVQIIARQTRPGARPILLVKFLEEQAVDFQPHLRRAILSFVNEIVPLSPDNLLILAGSAPTMAANHFYQEDGFARPSPEILEFLRTHLPEDQ